MNEFIQILKKLYESVENKGKNVIDVNDIEISNLKIKYEIFVWLIYKEILIITDQGYRVNLKLLREYIEKLSKN
jgi:hypothetical protein